MIMINKLLIIKKPLSKITLNSIFSFCFTILNGSFLFAGGVHIGGGNASERIPVGSEEIQRLILHYHAYRSEFITTLKVAGIASERILAVESQLDTPLDPIEKSKIQFQAQLYRSLFNYPIDPNRIQNIKVNFTSSGCLDNLGNENDASVVEKDLNSICFSLSRLDQKLGKDNYEVELLALYVHELTHCFGSNEIEAETVQNDLRQLGPKVIEYLSFLDPSKANLKNQLQDVLKQVQSLKKELNPLNYCKSISSLSEKVLNLTISQVGQTAGQAVLGFNGILAFHGAFVVSSYLTDFCNPQNEVRKQIKLRGNNQIQVKELYPDPTMLFAPLGHDNVLKLSAFLLADLSDAVVLASSVGNMSAMRTNLNELERLLILALNL